MLCSSKEIKMLSSLLIFKIDRSSKWDIQGFTRRSKIINFAMVELQFFFSDIEGFPSISFNTNHITLPSKISAKHERTSSTHPKFQTKPQTPPIKQQTGGTPAGHAPSHLAEHMESLHHFPFCKDLCQPFPRYYFVYW